MDFTLVLNQMVVLFVLIAIGYVCKKKGILDDHAAGKMTSFVVNVAIPALIISTMIKSSSTTGASFSGILFISIVFYLAMFLMAVTMPRLFNISEDSKGVYSFMLMFSNVGFMGIPVVNAIWGNEGVFTAIVFNLLYNTLVFTIGVRFMKNDRQSSVDLKKLLNLPIMANIVGLLLYFTGVQLPTVLLSSLTTVGGMTTPLALVIIGVSLANVDFRNLLSNGMLFFYSFLKLLIVPAAVYSVLSLFDISGIALGTVVILSGMPVAANSVIIAKEHGGDEALATEGVFVSTVMSIVTIPFIAYGLTYIGL